MDAKELPIFSPEIGSAETDRTDVSEEARMPPLLLKVMKVFGPLNRGNDGKNSVFQGGDDLQPEEFHVYLRDSCHKHVDMLVSFLRVLDFIRYGHEDYDTENNLKDLPWNSDSDESVVVERLARVAQRVLDLENYYRTGRRLDEYDNAVKAPKDRFVVYAKGVSYALQSRIFWIFNDLIPNSPFGLFPDEDVIFDYPHIVGPLANPNKFGRKFE